MKSSSDSDSPFTDAEYNHIADSSEHLGIDSVWHEISSPLNPPQWQARFPTFSARKQAFFWMLRRLLEEDRIFFVSKSDDKPLADATDSLLSQLENVFPTSEEELNNGIWFYLETCPLGVDWKYK